MAELIDELARIKAAKPARKILTLTVQETHAVEREINQQMKRAILKCNEDQSNSQLAASQIYLTS